MNQGKRPNLVGERYGKLLVVSKADVVPGRGQFWECVCDCGTPRTVSTGRLNAGVTHCGCSFPPPRLVDRRTHGEAGHTAKTPEYRSWSSMWTRCRNENYAEKHLYSARGITVCDRWKSYEAFLEDMGRRPTPKHSIDRIDNDKGYSPENCRWADDFEQGRNKRNNRWITFRGVTKCLAEWARELKVNPATIHERLGRYGDEAGLTKYLEEGKLVL